MPAHKFYFVVITASLSTYHGWINAESKRGARSIIRRLYPSCDILELH